MAVQINWALARTPDFSQNALAGFQAGQQQGKTQATQSALAQYKTDPEGSINALTSIDPVAAAQLRQAHSADEADQRQKVFRTALTKGDMKAATEAAAGDPTLMQSLGAVQTHMKALNEAQAAGLQAVSSITDPVERARVWDTTVAPGLVQLGQDPNAVSSKSGNIDFTDAGIKAAVGKTLSAKEQIELGFKEKDSNKPVPVAAGGALVTPGGKEVYKSDPNAPPGFKRNPDGSLDFIKGGPADPDVIRRNAEGKREVIINNPMPTPAGSGWQVLHDPKGNVDFRYNVGTGKSTTLDGSAPYAPQAAGRIASGMARSAAVLAAQAFHEEHPNATSDELSKFAADYGKRAAAAKGFGAGKQGDAVRRINVSMDHLGTLATLGEALDNGNIQLLNKAKADFQQQFGVAAPTNFDAAKQFVLNEITAATLGGQGGVGDREKANSAVSRASSPKQLAGVIKDTIQPLLAGQLHGLKRQYEASTRFDDFDSMISPETAAKLQTYAPPSAAKGGARPSLDQLFPRAK